MIEVTARNYLIEAEKIVGQIQDPKGVLPSGLLFIQIALDIIYPGLSS